MPEPEKQDKDQTASPNASKSGEFEYDGRHVTFDHTDMGVSLTIDGIAVPGVMLMENGNYHGHLYNMFEEFPDIEAMAKYLVDTEGRLWKLARPTGDNAGKGPDDMGGM